MAAKAKASEMKSSPKRDAAPAAGLTPVSKSTPARNTTVPPKAKAAASANGQSLSVTREMIAERAYHLWRAGAPGGELEHWCAAERELRGK